MSSELDPLIQIVAEAIDPGAFKGSDEVMAMVLLQRRAALARAKAGIRIAQALGWRFIPPGEFEILSAGQLDEICDRAKANLKDAADGVERP